MVDYHVNIISVGSVNKFGNLENDPVSLLKKKSDMANPTINYDRFTRDTEMVIKLNHHQMEVYGIEWVCWLNMSTLDKLQKHLNKLHLNNEK